MHSVACPPWDDGHSSNRGPQTRRGAATWVQRGGAPPRPRPLLPAEGSLKRAEDRQQIEDRGHGQVQMEL